MNYKISGGMCSKNPRALTAKSAPLIVASGTLIFRTGRSRLRGIWQGGEACPARGLISVRVIVPVLSNLRLFKARVRIRGDRARSLSLRIRVFLFSLFFFWQRIGNRFPPAGAARLTKPAAILNFLPPSAMALKGRMCVRARNETQKAMQPQHACFAPMGRHVVTVLGNYAAAGPKLRRQISCVFRYQTCGAETQK